MTCKIGNFLVNCRNFIRIAIVRSGKLSIMFKFTKLETEVMTKAGSTSAKVSTMHNRL